MKTRKHEKFKKNWNLRYKQMSYISLKNEQRIGMIVGLISIMTSATLELEGLSLVIQKLIKFEGGKVYQHHSMTTRISVSRYQDKHGCCPEIVR
jgi:hypothetical protein